MPDERRYRLTNAAMQPHPDPGFLSGLDRRGGEHRARGLAHPDAAERHPATGPDQQGVS